MGFFTEEDFGSMNVDSVEYNYDVGAWEFHITHSEESYFLRTFELLPPDQIIEGHIGFEIRRLMLMCENKTDEKKRIEEEIENRPRPSFDLGEFIKKTVSDLKKETPPPKTPQSGVIEFLGALSRFDILDGGSVPKYTVHLLLYTDNESWDFGPQNEDSGWIEAGRTVIINGIAVNLTNIINMKTGLRLWSYAEG
jgi:hypothetical protein